MQRIALLILAFCSIALAFAPRSNRITTMVRTRMAKAEEQTITDLNLEQMFDTFEAADKKVSASDLPKGAVSKYDDKKSTVTDSSDSSSSAAPIIALVAVAGLAAIVASKMM